MSQEHLDRALQEMNDEEVDAATLDAARARVWSSMTNAASAPCAEFRQDFRAYLANELSDGRRVLVEDHLGRCAGCRARLADLKGERTVIPMPVRTSSRWIRYGGLAAAAALLLSLLYVGRDAIDGLMAPGGPRATVVSAEGGLYRLPVGPIGAGGDIGERESVRTGPGSHAVLRLADGSMVDVNERTELYVTAAWSGQAIHLQRGDIIVKAAKQRRGHLQVLTRDSIASVKGTVFAVSAGMGGSVVSVVEGSVAVNQPGKDVLLKPGQQAASMPALASSVATAVSWSPDAESYLQLLASFVKIERELANVPTELRTHSTLLSYMPASAVVYGAMPNPGLTLGRALSLAEEESGQNAAFGAWWNSQTGQLLKQMTDRVQTVNQLLGDEIVFCASLPGTGEPVPIVMAGVRAGKRAELASALEGLFATAGETPAAYSVSDDLLIVSSSASNLAWAVAHQGQGASSPFATALGDRYRRGAGWLIGMDAPPVVEMAAGDDAPPIEFAGMMGMKYVFFEQRAPAGAVENEVTLAFQGARTGMGSWLADAGSGGAAEYLPADALVAGSVSTREPLQLFEEFAAQATRVAPDFQRSLASLEETLGAGFVQSLAGALGTEAAVALTGLSASGPTWVMASVANNPGIIDSSLRQVVDAFNAELGPEQQAKRIVLQQESAGGRTWNTLTPGGLPIGIVWTYDRGYLVASSDRGSAERAIATRNGGAQLVWSPAFLGQLPSSSGLHPSAFVWLNAKGALGILSTVMVNPKIGELLAGSDPILVVFDGTPEQIHAASRTRISGLIMDAMLIQSLGPPPTQQ